jgi:hypothetical protein
MSKSKIGLLIGCNYTNTTTPLKGCTMDAINMKGILIDAYQYDQNKIILLRDDNPNINNLPTKQSIINNLKQLISVSYTYSEICIYYSGHGCEPTSLQTMQNPAIVPCDYINAGCISNDDIFAIIQYTQCPIKIIFDSLQSIQNNSGLNLQYLYVLQPPIPDPKRNPIPIINMSINSSIIINQLITLYSRTDTNKITDSIISLMRGNNYSVKYNDLLYNIKNIILYTSQQLNLNNNYMTYLYWNYQYLLETVNNLNK